MNIIHFHDCFSMTCPCLEIKKLKIPGLFQVFRDRRNPDTIPNSNSLDNRSAPRFNMDNRLQVSLTFSSILADVVQLNFKFKFYHCPHAEEQLSLERLASDANRPYGADVWSHGLRHFPFLINVYFVFWHSHRNWKGNALVWLWSSCLKSMLSVCKEHTTIRVRTHVDQWISRILPGL